MAAVGRSDGVFHRHGRPSLVHREPRPVELPEIVGSTEVSGELGRIATRFGLQPRDGPAELGPAPALAAAILQAAELWVPPRPGQVQQGVAALCGGRAPASLVGVRLWPVLSQSAARPALVLVDIRHRVHVVADIAASGRPVRPSWVAAAAIAFGARTAGSHQLWRHWHPELCAHAPHERTLACDDHAHLARANAQGHLVAAIPQHDAWMMSRSWLPAELVMLSTADVHWVVLSASDRPLRERDDQIRSRWDAVSFEDFGAVIAAYYGEDAALSPSIATVLEMMLPVVAPGSEPD